MGFLKGIAKASTTKLATKKQWAFLRELCEETGNDSLLGELDDTLSAAEIGAFIDELIDERAEQRSGRGWNEDGPCGGGW